MYKVLADFSDLKDKEYVYRAGDKYPRPGFNVPAERLKELATSANKRGFPLIAEADEETPTEPKKPAETAPKQAGTGQEITFAGVQKTKARRRTKKTAE